MSRAAVRASVHFLSVAVLAISATRANGQGATMTGRVADEQAIRAVLDNQIKGWNTGDAVLHGRDVAEDVLFTNIRGQSFVGADAFTKQHAAILGTVFKNTTGSQDIEELKFLSDDIAVVKLITSVTGIAKMPGGPVLDAKGRLRTRLLEILVRRGSTWKVVAYHNVDVKPGIDVPEPGAKYE